MNEAFEEIFRPGERAVCIGAAVERKEIPPSTDSMEWTHTYMESHDLSGWYGISGAMICAWYIDPKTESFDPKVVGLCKVTRLTSHELNRLTGTKLQEHQLKRSCSTPFAP